MRLRSFHHLLSCIFALLIVGCATGGVIASASSSIQPGDPRAKVIQLLGEPGDRQFSGDDEALQFCRKTGNAIAGSEAGEFTVVWLFQGRVTGITTYRETLATLKGCASAFRMVDWAQAPRRGDTRPPS